MERITQKKYVFKEAQSGSAPPLPTEYYPPPPHTHTHTRMHACTHTHTNTHTRVRLLLLRRTNTSESNGFCKMSNQPACSRPYTSVAEVYRFQDTKLVVQKRLDNPISIISLPPGYPGLPSSKPESYTLGIKVSYKVILGMIKHSQSTRSNKFAISLRYLKK